MSYRLRLFDRPPLEGLPVLDELFATPEQAGRRLGSFPSETAWQVLKVVNDSGEEHDVDVGEAHAFRVGVRLTKRRVEA